MRDDNNDLDERQGYTVDILNKLIQYKEKSTYAILGVTLCDLYPTSSAWAAPERHFRALGRHPSVNWNYVFGWANFGRGSGVFSFKRYHPDYSMFKSHTYDDYIRLACHTMAHEIGHMFALHHCPYYECLMNGYNSL